MYTVAVKIEGMERRRRTTGLLHIIIGFYFILKTLDLLNYTEARSIVPILPFLLIGIVSVAYGFFRRRFDPIATYNARLRFLQGIGFFSFGILLYRIGARQLDYCLMFVWMAICLLLYFSEKKIFAVSLIQFTADGIIIPGSYKQHLVPWHTLESVTVRHDFITLFHQGKRFLQYQVLQDLAELELVKLNSFCKEQIERAISDL